MTEHAASILHKAADQLEEWLEDENEGDIEKEDLRDNLILLLDQLALYDLDDVNLEEVHQALDSEDGGLISFEDLRDTLAGFLSDLHNQANALDTPALAEDAPGPAQPELPTDLVDERGPEI